MEFSTINWKGRFGPFELKTTPSTFTPTTISLLMADAMAIKKGDTVIDVGSGTGILAIVAAKLGAGRVFAVDTSPDAEEVGQANAEDRGVADRITFFRGDLFDPIPPDVQADVIIGDVSGIPDDLAHQSGWFPSLKGGGPRGSELPIRMLQEAKRWIKPGGRLFLPTGSLQDEAAILKAARSLYGKLSKLAERGIPLPAKLADSSAIAQLIKEGIVKLVPRGSRFLWEARVWEVKPGAA